MPLDETDRAAISKIPPLTMAESPASRDLSYDQFQFDHETDEIGRGGNSVVYCADVADEDLTVALKLPIPGATTTVETSDTIDITTVEALFDEAERWASVDNHPYITGVVDWGVGDSPWIAIEYMDGGPLADYIGEFDIEQRLWTTFAIADGVAHAAGKGLAHHDITPNNILFRTTPENMWDKPKVADWGLARELIQHDGKISQATPEYAAPEHFDAHMPDATVDEQTDVYQLGVVSYELLTGEHPNHLQGDIRPPSEVDPRLPTTINPVIQRALAHDQNVRHGHPWGFRNALEEVVVETLIDDNLATTATTDSERVSDEESHQTDQADKATASQETSPIAEIEGLGSTHAEQLNEVGIQMVDDLVAADVAELAETVDIPQTRLSNWIERAQSRHQDTDEDITHTDKDRAETADEEKKVETNSDTEDEDGESGTTEGNEDNGDDGISPVVGGLLLLLVVLVLGTGFLFILTGDFGSGGGPITDTTTAQETQAGEAAQATRTVLVTQTPSSPGFGVVPTLVILALALWYHFRRI